MIRLDRVTKRFGEVEAVSAVDIEVPPGAFLALLGPSGCGKTTTLRMLAGLEEPTDGEIYLAGHRIADGRKGTVVPPGERDTGMVFQSYALWPHMKVWANVEWPLKVKRWSARRRRARIKEVLDLLGILPLAGRYPGEISGGQQQRVAIARTIAPEPKVLLFDEPLSNLDAKLRAEMRTELMRIHRLTGSTSVYVTHDQVEAMTMATHIAVMKDGNIEQFGAPRALLDDPETPFVAQFIGTPPANLFNASVRNGRYRSGSLDFGPAQGRSEGEGCLLMYRAHDLELRAAASGAGGAAGSNGERTDQMEVEFVEATPVADRTLITVWHENKRISIVSDDAMEARSGDTFFLEFPDRPARVYAAGGSTES